MKNFIHLLFFIGVLTCLFCGFGMPSGEFLIAIEPVTALGIGAATSGLFSGLSGIGSGRRAQSYASTIGGKILKKGDQYAESDLKLYGDDLARMGQWSDTYQKLADQYGDEAAKAYLDTTEGRSFMSQLNRTAGKQRDNWRDTNTLAGGTTESLLAGYDSINESEAGAMSDLVAGADARRTTLRNSQLASLGMAYGADASQTNLKQNIINNARNYATSAYGNAMNMGNQVVGNQVNAMATGFGQLSNSFSQLAAAS